MSKHLIGRRQFNKFFAVALLSPIAGYIVHAASSVQQIRAYEDGSQQISTDHIDRLAAVLKVLARFFLDPVDRGITANDLAPGHFQTR